MDITRDFLSLMDGAASSGVGVGARAGTTPLAAVALDVKRRAGAVLPASASAFTRAAGEVSRELHATSAKVQQLTKSAWLQPVVCVPCVSPALRPLLTVRPLLTLLPTLPPVVRRRGVFDPSSGASGGSDVDRLTASIKVDLQRTTGALDALQAIVDSRKAEAVRVGAAAGGRRLPPMAPSGPLAAGGAPAAPVPPPGDAPCDPVSSVQGLSHSEAVVSGLKGALLGVAHSLRGVVAVRSENVAKSAERRQLYGGGISTRDLGKPFSATAAAVALDEGSGGRGAGDAIISVGHSDAFSAVTHAQLSRDPELAFLSARAQDVASLEETINELGSLFGRLASVIAEQGAQVRGGLGGSSWQCAPHPTPAPTPFLAGGPHRRRPRVCDRGL